MKIEWIDGYRISVNIDNKEVTISANKEGLLSLARQLQALAEGVPGDRRADYRKSVADRICAFRRLR